MTMDWQVADKQWMTIESRSRSLTRSSRLIVAQSTGASLNLSLVRSQTIISSSSRQKPDCQGGLRFHRRVAWRYHSPPLQSGFCLGFDYFTSLHHGHELTDVA